MPVVDDIDAIIGDAINRGVFPGAVVLVARDGTVRKRAAYGYSVLYDRSGRRCPDPIATTADTIFDLASLTKVVATTTAVLQLVEAGALALDAPASTYLDEFARADKRAITVRHLLTHTAGLPADRPFHKRFRDPTAIVAAAGRVRMAGAPGVRVLYSDVGFIALGAIVERVSGLTLDRYVARRIAAPLGLRHTRYRPPPAWRPRVAATECQAGRGVVWGVVHDDKAAAMGGIAGHAGLFSDAADLATFTTALLDAERGVSSPLLRPGTVREMFDAHTGALSPPRGLGWLCDDPSFMGALASPRTVGHTGFTCTSIVLDLERRLSVILLTNRVHPSREGPALGPVRSAVAEAAAL